ncbi:HNH endonuclease [Rhodococcus erythropolis]|uniref:HNH endonuclease n=1 Tax=Rhodococcus erythropolis TaxID=1833 RepID=UPI003670A97F
MQPEPECRQHRAQRDAHQWATTPTKTTRTAAEQKRRATAVTEHRAREGNWCPGYENRQPHPATDLTADHITAIANGGAPDGPLQVLCRSCNSARSNRF